MGSVFTISTEVTITVNLAAFFAGAFLLLAGCRYYRVSVPLVSALAASGVIYFFIATLTTSALVAVILAAIAAAGATTLAVWRWKWALFAVGATFGACFGLVLDALA